MSHYSVLVKTDFPGLQITVGQRTLADQNLLMSDESPSVVGHDARTMLIIFFYHKSFYGNNGKTLSDHNFVSFDQDGVLVEHNVLLSKKTIFAALIFSHIHV